MLEIALGQLVQVRVYVLTPSKVDDEVLVMQVAGVITCICLLQTLWLLLWCGLA